MMTTPPQADRCSWRYLQRNKADPGGSGHNGHRQKLPGAVRFREAYQSSIDALGYKAIAGRGTTIYINDMEPVGVGKLEFDSVTEADLISAIKFGPSEKIEAAVARIIEKMESAKVHYRQQQVICSAF